MSMEVFIYWLNDYRLSIMGVPLRLPLYLEKLQTPVEDLLDHNSKLRQEMFAQLQSH